MTQNSMDSIAGVVLAAGKGTRMRSTLPKVMHSIASRPLVNHVIDGFGCLDPDLTVVVVGPGMEATVGEAVAGCSIAVQTSQQGTADAVKAARDLIAEFQGTVFILYGDSPFISEATLRALAETRRGSVAVAMVGFRPDDPTGYGRIVTGADGMVDAVVEHLDATPEQRAIALCNGGVMAIDGQRLFGLLDRITNDNAKGEYYLTDIVMLARSDGLGVMVVEAAPDELMGINNRAELAIAEAVMQDRLRARALEQGVTLIDPKTVWLSGDTSFGQDIIIEPNVFIGLGVSIADRVRIRAFSHLEGAVVGSDAVVGPYARLRPGTVLEEKVRIGNFVEVKAATFEAGAKANHLSYVGDSFVGAGSNIGAGTITCNYDGFSKHQTRIEAEAFIGSNTALVAPVTVGRAAIVGAGSTITRNVPENGLAVARGRQTVTEGGAERVRGRLAKAKAAKANPAE